MSKKNNKRLYVIKIFEAGTTSQHSIFDVLAKDFADAVKHAEKEIKILNKEFVQEWQENESGFSKEHRSPPPAGPYYEIGSIMYDRNLR